MHSVKDENEKRIEPRYDLWKIALKHEKDIQRTETYLYSIKCTKMILDDIRNTCNIIKSYKMKKFFSRGSTYDTFKNQ